MFFKRQKTEDKLSKKTKQGKNIDHSFVNFIPRPKAQGENTCLQTTSASTKGSG